MEKCVVFYLKRWTIAKMDDSYQKRVVLIYVSPCNYNSYFVETNSPTQNASVRYCRFINSVRPLRSAQYYEYQKDAESRHFALGADKMTTFSSPLRRYADIVVHRQIKRLLGGESIWDENYPSIQNIDAVF